MRVTSRAFLIVLAGAAIVLAAGPMFGSVPSVSARDRVKKSLRFNGTATTLATQLLIVPEGREIVVTDFVVRNEENSTVEAALTNVGAPRMPTINVPVDEQFAHTFVDGPVFAEGEIVTFNRLLLGAAGSGTQYYCAGYLRKG